MSLPFALLMGAAFGSIICWVISLDHDIGERLDRIETKLNELKGKEKE